VRQTQAWADVPKIDLVKTWLRDKVKYKKLIGLALAFLLVATALGWYYLRSTASEQQPEIITYSTDTPDETRPDNGYKWRGRAGDPKYIRLPSIQTEGFIQNVGVDQNKQVAVPNNIHLAGWFVDSVRPGQTGLSIVDGHVDGRAETGIFKRLADLKENDEYAVEMGDGSLKRYRVKKVVAIDTKDAANVLFSQDPKVKSQLNLITCGGNFDQQSQQYDKRIIVVSELVS